MKERPMLFNSDMVRATLEGRKTKTRRVVKPQPFVEYWKANGETMEPVTEDVYRNSPGWPNDRNMILRKTESSRGASPELWAMLNCPYGQPGDRLWVRETWGVHYDFDDRSPSKIPLGGAWYKADNSTGAVSAVKKWRPSIHMPRNKSRILLEIISIRVERLQDISVEDATAEGFPGVEIDGNRVQWSPRGWFFSLWDSINGFGAYEKNPWVWVVEFRRVEA